MPSLSDATIRALTPPPNGQKLYADGALPGFGCRVSAGGVKAFVLQLGADRRKITLGRYPIITLSEAREEAKRILAEHTLGKSRPPSITYEDAVKEFLDDKARSARPSTIKAYKRHLHNLGIKGQLAKLSHSDAARRINRISAPSERAHAIVYAKVFFNWCMKRRYLTENPLIGLSKPSRAPRARVLTDDELTAIWRATEASTPFNGIVRFCLLTGQRRGEVALLTPKDVTPETCTIPDWVAKNRKTHTFPVTSYVQALVAGRHNYRFLFSDTDKPFANWGKAKADLNIASGTSGWTLHDIRRTVATRMAEMGVAPHVIERLLNHITGSISPVGLIYNRATYFPELTVALLQWQTKLLSIVG